MPELPEVETIARGLARRVTSDVIDNVWLGSKPEPLKSPASEIAATLQGRRISDVRRVGKHIVFDLEADGADRLAKRTPGRRRKNSANLHKAAPTALPAQWIVHLGMTGRMLVCDPAHE